MSIFQQQDRNGRWQIQGDGVVVTRGDNPAVHESLTYGDKRVPRVTFLLKVGTYSEKDESTGALSWKNHTVNACVYGVVGQELLYSFARTLKSGDSIVFWGKLWEKQNAEDGNIYREIQISAMLPITPILQAIMGTSGTEFAKMEISAARELGLDPFRKNKRKDKGDLPF
jgi:hypothetical protein